MPCSPYWTVVQKHSSGKVKSLLILESTFFLTLSIFTLLDPAAELEHAFVLFMFMWFSFFSTLRAMCTKLKWYNCHKREKCCTQQPFFWKVRGAFLPGTLQTQADADDVLIRAFHITTSYRWHSRWISAVQHRACREGDSDENADCGGRSGCPGGSIRLLLWPTETQSYRDLLTNHIQYTSELPYWGTEKVEYLELRRWNIHPLTVILHWLRVTHGCLNSMAFLSCLV